MAEAPATYTPPPPLQGAQLVLGTTDVPYGDKDDAFILMGSNKSLLRARLNPNGDDVKNWGNFTAGRTQVEHVGGLGRARVRRVAANRANAPQTRRRRDAPPSGCPG